MNLRLSQSLRKALERSAKHAGRDLSDEIRARLQASYTSTEFRDSETRGLVALIALALDHIVCRQEGHAWHQTKRSFDHAQRAIDVILSWYDPGGEPKVPDDHPALLAAKYSGLGDDAVERTRQDLQKADWGLLTGNLVLKLCEMVADENVDPKAPAVPHLVGSVPSTVKAKLVRIKRSGKPAQEYARHVRTVRKVRAKGDSNDQ